jgi:hypothetical protein
LLKAARNSIFWGVPAKDMRGSHIQSKAAGPCPDVFGREAICFMGFAQGVRGKKMSEQSSEQDPRDRLRRMLPDIRVIQMIYVAAKLGIADLLSEGPATVEELANACNAHAPTLYRLLRALASLGIFTEVEPAKFGLSEVAELLRSDVTDSMRNKALWLGEPWRWRPFGELLYSVQTGQPAFHHVFGENMFDYLRTKPDADAIFNQSMTEMTNIKGAAVADLYDFNHASMVIDIGGGHGALLASILNRYPLSQGTLFDSPAVLEGAGSLLSTEGVLERCKLVGGSFFEECPKGGDIYILKLIIQDWDDERALSILRNCHAAMEKGATLLIIERIIPSGNERHHGKIVDIEMLTLFGSQERTEAEYRKLLNIAGFKIQSILPTPADVDIIEAYLA